MQRRSLCSLYQGFFSKISRLNPLPYRQTSSFTALETGVAALHYLYQRDVLLLEVHRRREKAELKLGLNINSQTSESLGDNTGNSVSKRLLQAIWLIKRNTASLSRTICFIISQLSSCKLRAITNPCHYIFSVDYDHKSQLVEAPLTVATCVLPKRARIIAHRGEKKPLTQCHGHVSLFHYNVAEVMVRATELELQTLEIWIQELNTDNNVVSSVADSSLCRWHLSLLFYYVYQSLT